MVTPLSQLFTTSPLRYPPDWYRKAYTTFLQTFHFQEIETLVLSKEDPLQTCGFHLNSSDLIDYNPWIAFNTFEHPKLLIKIFEESIKMLQEKVIQSNEFKRITTSVGQNDMIQHASVKVNVQVRFMNLPPTQVYNKRLIGEIDAEDVGRLIQLTGTIVKISPIKLLEVSKLYECKRARCAHRFRVYADPEQNFQLPQPRKCPSSSSGTGQSDAGNSDKADGVSSTKACQSVEFVEMEGSKVCVDFQEIKIQDKIESLKPGTTPKNLSLVVSGDLVDQFNPGDSVTVIGYLIRQWRFINRNERCILKTTLLVNNIFSSRNTSAERSIQNHDFKSWKERFIKYWMNYRNNIFAGRDFIVKSFCPQLYGMYYTKLAVLLTLVGGSESTGSSSSEEDNKRRRANGNQLQPSNAAAAIKIRTQPHLLIVGDPG